MGISGLLPALSPITKNIHIKEYSGKRVAIDGYSWLHKGSYSCSEEICQGKPTQKYINYCLNHIRMLRQYNLIPIVVFDGGPLPNKKLKEEERHKSREEYKNKAKAYLLEGNRTLANTCFQKAVDITPKMAFNLIRELRNMGVEYLVAPFEADAQLAYLALTGQVDAVITEDSDLIAYGTPNIIFKMDKQGYAQEIKIEDISSCNKGGYNFIDFNLTMLRHMCILSGCDYLPSLTGMGLKTAYKLIKQYRDIEAVFRHIKREKRIIITQDYEINFNRADFTFKHQRVYDPVSKSLETVQPLDKEYHEEDIFFIGPVIESRIAELISLGVIDPNSFEEFDKNSKLPQKPTFIIQPKKEIQKQQLNISIRSRNNNNNKKSQSQTKKPQDHFAANKITNYFSPITKTTNNTTNIDLDIEINDSDLEIEINDSPIKKNLNSNQQQQLEDDEFILDSDYEEIPSSDEEYTSSLKTPNSVGNNYSINNSSKKKKQMITSKFFGGDDDNILNDYDKVIADSDDELLIEDSDTSFEYQPNLRNTSDKLKYQMNNNSNNNNSSSSTGLKTSPPLPTSQPTSNTLLTQERISLNFLQQFQFNGKKKDSILFTSTKAQSSLQNSLSLSNSNNSVNNKPTQNNNNSTNSINNNNNLKLSTSTSPNTFNNSPVNINLQSAFINSLNQNNQTPNSSSNKKRTLSEIDDTDFSTFSFKKVKNGNNKSQPTTPLSSQNSNSIGSNSSCGSSISNNSGGSIKKSSTYPSLQDHSTNNNISFNINDNSSTIDPMITNNDNTEISPTKLEIVEQEKSLNNFHINNNHNNNLNSSYGNSSAAILSKYFSSGGTKLFNSPSNSSANTNGINTTSPSISPPSSVTFKSRLLQRAKQAMESSNSNI